MAEKIRVMIPEEEVDAKIKELGQKISEKFAGEEVHLICILKGSVFFVCELAKRITVPVTIDFMQVSSYGAETKSSGVVRLSKDLDEPLQGKNVIIVEDIIDSGRTLSHLVKLLGQRNPKTMTLCTLLDKPDRRVVDVDVEYTGFTIPDEFVVGYGLDYDQKYRNLPYIGVLEFVDYRFCERRGLNVRLYIQLVLRRNHFEQQTISDFRSLSGLSGAADLSLQHLRKTDGHGKSVYLSAV